VHGKNPYKDGTFSDWVKALTVFHPHKGYQTCSSEQNPELFALTCGGYGLTGVITEVTLQLARLPAPSIALGQRRVSSPGEAVDELASCDADIAYSWHDASAGSNFGRGIVYSGQWAQGAAQPGPLKFRPMTAQSRARLPVSAWNGITARIANSALLLHSRYKKDVSVMGIMDASFPFASNVYFHMLFGRPGLRETQFLVSDERIRECLGALEKRIRETGAPTMMLSLKRFKGVQKSLSMSGNGYLVALDCYRNARTDSFMHLLDQLILDMGGQPNLSKDSRIPRDVAQASIASFDGFKRGIFAYDETRIMRSELSARLGLL
jgi:decaprenylphospho-beta-D-ribofuranose 2-oxidase